MQSKLRGQAPQRSPAATRPGILGRYGFAFLTARTGRALPRPALPDAFGLGSTLGVSPRTFGHAFLLAQFVLPKTVFLSAWTAG